MNYFINSFLTKVQIVKIFLHMNFLMFLQSLVRRLTGIRDVQVVDGPATCTDGKKIYLSRKVSAYLDEQLRVSTITLCYIADVAHEGGHLLFTSFEVLWAIYKEDFDASFLTSKEKEMIKEKVVKYTKHLDNYEKKALADILNIIEDGGMERQAGEKMGRMVQQAIKTSNLIILNRRPTLNELTANKSSLYDILTEATLSLSVSHFLNGTIEDDDARALFNSKIAPLVRKGVASNLTIERFEVAKEIFELLKPYLQAKRDEQKKNQQNTNSNQQNGQGESQGSGNSGNSEDNNEQNGSSSSNNGSEEYEEHSKSNVPQESNDKNSQGSNRQTPDQTQGQSGSNNKNADETNNENSSSNNGNSSSNGNSEDKNGTSSNSSQNTGDDKDPDFGSEPISQDFEELVKQANEESSQELTAEIRNAVDKIKNTVDNEDAKENALHSNDKKFESLSGGVKMYGNECINKGIDISAIVQKEMYAENYNKIVQKHASTIAIFIDYFSQLLKPTKTRKVYGKEAERLDDKLLWQHKFNPTIKYDNFRQTKKIPFKVLILGDKSGSMMGSAYGNITKLQAMQEACIILAEVFEALDVPFAVLTHSAGNNRVEMTCYKDFDNDNSDKYRLGKMEVSRFGCNRDGVALRFVKEYLADTRERVIVFSISDGMPNDSGYSGQAARIDTHLAAEELADQYEVIGIGIGSGISKENISSIYPRNVKVDDLSQLAATLVQQIEV